MVPVGPVITFIFTFLMRYNSIASLKFFYINILKISQLISSSLFYLLELPTSIDTHVPLFIMTDYGVRLIVTVGSVGLHFLIP